MKRALGLVFAAAIFVGPAAWASDYDGRDECGGYSYNGDCDHQQYDQWNNEQRNHNRRNRGAFSPGPFDRSPVDAFNGNTVCLPGSTCEQPRDDRGKRRGEEGRGEQPSEP